MAQQKPKGDFLRTTVSLKLSPDEYSKLKKIADKDERSVSYVVSQMVEEAIKKLS